MKQMLSTLIDSGTISVSDIASALYDKKETESMEKTLQNIPKIGYRDDRGEYYITIPKKLSKTGKRYPVYGKSEDEVINNYKLEVSLHNQGVQVGEETIIPTLNVMLDYTFKNILFPSLSESSYLTYEGLCKNHIRNQDFANKRIDTITQAELYQYFNSKEMTDINGISVSNIRTILKRTFHQAEIFKYVKINPMETIAVNVRKYKPPKKVKQRLSPAEIERLSTAVVTLCQIVPKYRYTPMFMFMIYTGLRGGETMAIKNTDLDIEKRKLELTSQLEYLPSRDRNLKRGKFSLQEKPPKYNSSRIIPLSSQAIYWIQIMQELNKRDGFESQYLFLNKMGKTPSKASINDIWHNLLDEVGLPYCTPHKLRKTFTTALLDNGDVSLPDVASILGHKDKRMALNTYFTTLDDNTFDESMINKLDNIFDNTLTTGSAANNLRRYI